MIACVSLIGKDNEPLFLRTFTTSQPSSLLSPSVVPSLVSSAQGPQRWNDDAIKFHYFIHTSLDIMEEKISNSKKSSILPTITDAYLGLLFTMEEYKIYGYITNTKIKIIVVLQDCNTDINMKSWFRDLHTLYISTMCNPFSDYHTCLQNPYFEINLQKQVKNFMMKNT